MVWFCCVSAATDIHKGLSLLNISSLQVHHPLIFFWETLLQLHHFPQCFRGGEDGRGIPQVTLIAKHIEKWPWWPNVYMDLSTWTGNVSCKYSIWYLQAQLAHYWGQLRWLPHLLLCGLDKGTQSHAPLQSSLLSPFFHTFHSVFCILLNLRSKKRRGQDVGAALRGTEFNLPTKTL